MISKRTKSQKEQRPPKKWWEKMKKEISKGSPDYSEERVAKTIGEIWFHNLKEKKRKQISKRDRVSDDKKKKKKEAAIDILQNIDNLRTRVNDLLTTIKPLMNVPAELENVVKEIDLAKQQIESMRQQQAQMAGGTGTTTGTSPADDEVSDGSPNPWRRNLDYGERPKKSEGAVKYIIVYGERPLIFEMVVIYVHVSEVDTYPQRILDRKDFRGLKKDINKLRADAQAYIKQLQQKYPSSRVKKENG